MENVDAASWNAPPATDARSLLRSSSSRRRASISRLSASLRDAAVCALPAAIPFWYPMDAAWRILPSTSPRTSRGSHARDRSDPDASLMASLAVRKVPDVDEGVELPGWSFYFHGTTILKLPARSRARVSENPRCHAGRVSLRPVPLSRGDCPVERAAPDCGGGGPATSFSKIVDEAAALDFFFCTGFPRSEA